MLTVVMICFEAFESDEVFQSVNGMMDIFGLGDGMHECSFICIVSPTTKEKYRTLLINFLVHVNTTSSRGLHLPSSYMTQSIEETWKSIFRPSFDANFGLLNIPRFLEDLDF